MTIELDHSTFRATLHHLRSSAEDLCRTRLALEREVDLLLGEGWAGAAASAYAEGWADWQAAADAVLHGLVEITHLMEAAQRDLTGRDLATQAALDRLAERIMTRLGP